MKIRDLFEKDVSRQINGVIKVEQDREEIVKSELEEFVVTKELLKLFNKFYSSYSKSLDTPTDKMGVWISGFFGSGKSHLLKMLSYLLSNKEISGIKPTHYFHRKIDDPMLIAKIEKTGRTLADAILFNIDSKAASKSKASKTAIVDVLMKVFNDHQGYCGDIPWLAQVERHLDQMGVYSNFKEKFKQAADEEWNIGRKKIHFQRDIFVKTLTDVTEMTQESAMELFDHAKKDYVISPDEFTKLIKEYLDKKGASHRIIFLIDELGQYVGDNTSLMLNLQTITEDLGIHCQGRAWLIVTAQEALENVTKRFQDQDFSKIQGRFDTRLNLSSSNTDEVIKRRLLSKTDASKDSLNSYYHEKNALLKNKISFTQDTAGIKTYEDEYNFAETYPFVPYQFNLLQDVFEAIRKFSFAGKHLSEGERSMLNAFQMAAIEISEEEVGQLVPFNIFYSTFEDFIDSSVKRVFDKVSEDDRIDEFDNKVLKILFMIKYIQRIPPNIENITTLMLSHIDADRLALKEKTESALHRLKSSILIQQSGELYEFLTDEEQDVNRGIKGMKIDNFNVADRASEILFNDILGYYKASNFKYSNYNTYSFSKEFDGKIWGRALDVDITIKVLSPDYEYHSKGQEQFIIDSNQDGLLIIRLPDAKDYLYEIEEIIKTEEYLRQKGDIKKSEGVAKIINAKSHELSKKKNRVIELIQSAVINSEVYASGDALAIEAKNAKDKIDNALKIIIQKTYRCQNFICDHFKDDKDIARALRGEYPPVSDNGNKKAEDEMMSIISQMDSLSKRFTMKDIKARFMRKPYGWALMDIAGIVAALFAKKLIKLEYHNESLEPKDRRLIDYLTKEKEFERLIIRAKREADRDIIEAARKIGRDIFNRYDLPDDQDELADNLGELIHEEINALEKSSAHYQKRPYPGEAIIKQGIELLGAIARLKDQSSFLSALAHDAQKIIKWKDLYGPVKAFMGSRQQELFDKALDAIKKYEQNKLYLDDDSIKESIEKLTAIIKSHAPYSSIKDIPYIIQEVETKYNELLDAEKNRVKAAIKKDLELVQRECDEHPLLKADESFCTSIIRPFEVMLDDCESAFNFSISALKDKSSRLVDDTILSINAKRREIEAQSAQIKASGNETPTAAVVKDKRELVRIDPTKYAHGKYFLETDEDVEQYINELRDELKRVIKENKRIRLL